jgi:hypothetical protein
MKKLLLASILMMVGTSANAIVTVETLDCSIDSETPPNTQCTAIVSCSAGPSSGRCTTELTDATLAICLPTGTRLVRVTLNALNTGTVEGASCTWTVTDSGDGDTLSFTIDGSNGLPVELQSLSIE